MASKRRRYQAVPDDDDDPFVDTGAEFSEDDEDGESLFLG